SERDERRVVQRLEQRRIQVEQLRRRVLRADLENIAVDDAARVRLRCRSCGKKRGIGDLGRGGGKDGPVRVQCKIDGRKVISKSGRIGGKLQCFAIVREAGEAILRITLGI